MPQYKIKHTSIMHNKTLCKEGSIIELTADEAARLEEFVELVPEQKTSSSKAQTSTAKNSTSKPKTQNQTKSAASETQPDNVENEGEGKLDDK